MGAWGCSPNRPEMRQSERESKWQESPSPSCRGLFIRRRKWLFMFILSVGLNIIRMSLKFTGGSLDATNKSLELIN